MSDTQNTEWVEVEGQWDITAGQLVEFRRSDEVCRVRIVGHNSRARWANAASGCFDSSVGWSLFIEKPKVQLPTEPGHYIDTYDAWAYLAQDGFWSDSNEYGIQASTIASRAPLIRVRPVAEVAAEVLAEARKAVHVYAGVNAEPLTLCAFDKIAAKWATK